MKLRLRRTSFTEDGIFGALWTEDGDLICYTLEHAYSSNNLPAFQPKVPPGTYECQRGMHQLANMVSPFETFEITGVPDHTGILFHCGNTNSDSSGCVLVGSEITGKVLLYSRIAFEAFLGLLEGMDTFTLEIS